MAEGGVDSNSHASWILQGLDEQRKSNSDLCDLEVKVRSAKFVAHRAILCRASEYFNALLMGNFVETDSKSVNLSSMIEKPRIFETILDYIYTGAFPITKDTINDLLHATSLLLLDKAKKFCVTFLFENLTLDNCIDTLVVTEKYDINDLSFIVMEMLYSHCHDHVIHTEQLIGCPLNIIVKVITMGVFKHLPIKHVHQFLHRRLTSQEFRDQDAANQLAEMYEIFSALTVSYEYASDLIRSTCETLDTLPGECQQQQIQDVVELFIHCVNEESNGLSPAGAMANGLQNLHLDDKMADKMAADVHEEAVFILRKGSRGENTSLYAYLTQQRMWIELAEYEPTDTAGFSSKLLIGMQYETGMNICYRSADMPITPAMMFNTETCMSTTCKLEDEHACGGTYEDAHTYICYKGALYCFSRTKYGLPDFSSEQAESPTVSHRHDEYVLLKYSSGAASGWKEILRFPVSEQQIKDEVESYTSAFGDRNQCIYVTSDDSFDVLVSHISAVKLESQETPEPTKRAFIYHFNESQSGELTCKTLPVLIFESNDTPFRLKYTLTADKDGVCVVPIHARTICTSAKMYKCNHDSLKWETLVMDGCFEDDLTNDPVQDDRDTKAAASSGRFFESKMIVKSVPNTYSVVETAEEPGIKIQENHGEPKPVGTITCMPGRLLLPIILKKDAPSGLRIQSHFFSSPHQYLAEQSVDKSLYQSSDLTPSGQNKVLYQTRNKGPYTTELWAYHVDSMQWEMLPAPPLHNCLEIKVGWLPRSISSERMLARFKPGIISGMGSKIADTETLFKHYKLMSVEEYKEKNAEDEIRSDADDNDDVEEYLPEFGVYGYDMYDDPLGYYDEYDDFEYEDDDDGDVDADHFDYWGV